MDISVNSLGSHSQDSSFKMVDSSDSLVNSDQEKKQIIDHLVDEISTIYSGRPKEIYTRILQETYDINAQYEGWTLLHYCVYMFSYEVREPSDLLLFLYADSGEQPPNIEETGQRLLNLIQYLLLHGADAAKEDKYGRTPIYFASTLYASQDALNKQYWDLLQPTPVLLNPLNQHVQPLHVVASLTQKFVIDFITRGAKTDALDENGRMPLHCATMHTNFDKEFYNVKALVSFEPKSLEHADKFGNFPLYYAAIFATPDCFDFVLEHTSRNTILAVLEKLTQTVFFADQEQLQELEQTYKIYDPIYNVPAELKIMFGAGPKAKKKDLKACLEESLEKKKTTYSKDGIAYYDTYHDGHGWKHVLSSAIYKQKFQDQRDFIKSTKNGQPAKFFPQVFEGDLTYEQLVTSSVEAWVDKGADLANPYVEFPESIGADNGNETTWVQIYFTASGGVHIRPKHR